MYAPSSEVGIMSGKLTRKILPQDSELEVCSCYAPSDGALDNELQPIGILPLKLPYRSQSLLLTL